MKTIPFFTFVFFSFTSLAVGQVKTATFSFQSTISENFFVTAQKDVPSILIVNHQKTTTSNPSQIEVLPKKYNWSKELRKIESYKELMLNARRQDLCGRDLPIDVHYEVTQQIYLRNLSF